MTRLLALLRGRCPHCLEGRVFATLWRTHEDCPVCGVRFVREDGYYMMAVFIGYVLGSVLIAPPLLLAYVLDGPVWWYVAISGLLVPLSPLIFRYSRLIWLHLDELFDPR
jgi:uncharacterized protein (DUF983 family)